MKITEAIAAVEAEYRRSMSLFPNFNSAHEGYAVMLEEVEELWDAIRAKQHSDDLDIQGRQREEAIHVGAMAIKFLVSMEAWR